MQDVVAASHTLITTVRSYASGVDMLKGPLEADVLEASEACWTMDERNVQVKSKLLVSFRTRQVKVIVPEFIAEAEQQLLGAALKQWHSSAEGVVASSILEVRVAEQRLLHAVYRLVQHASSDGNAMLELLDSMLTASAEFHDALAVRCASAHQTLRKLALYAGMKFMEPSNGQDDSRLRAWSQLIQVLQQHNNQTSWAAALLQVPISQLSGILPSVLCTDCEGSAGTEQGLEAGQLAACKVLFAQLPWEEVSELDADSIREGVRLPLLQHLTTLAGPASLGNSDAADLVHSIMTVMLLIAFKVPELKVETHGAIQVAILAIATGGSLQAVLDMLGGSFDGIVDANLLPWAQLAWGNGGAQADTTVAASLVQRLDWQELAFTLPGKLGMRVLLTLTATAGAVLKSNSSYVKQQYITWLWSLLLSSAGKALVQVDTSDVEDVQELCLAEAPDRTDAVSAVWSWIQMHLAVGLLEHWARLDDSSQSNQRAQMLLDNMHFFSVSHTLLAYGQGEAVVLVMMRFVEAAAALGDSFFRQNIDGLATALAPSLQAAEQGGSPTGVSPIKQNLQRLIKRGIAVNEATQTPNKATPESSPPESPRTPPPPKRGSTTSPGQEALATGSRWLAALVCCHHKAELAADGLSLLNDLVQLLYYHGSGVAHSLTVDDCNTSVHLLSPIVQECMETVMEVVGVEGMHSLWGSLMQKEAANARQLQWLAVLACWLSNTVSAAAASSPMAKHADPLPETPLSVKHEGEAEPRSPSKEQPNLASKPDEADVTASRPASESPVASSRQSALERAEQTPPAAEPADAAVPNYPPPPGAPPTTPGTQDTSPPPSYNQAMQQSTKHGKAAHAISRAVVTADQSEESSQGSSPSGSPSGTGQVGTGWRSEAAASMSPAGGVQLHGSHLEVIDRSAEEALQIQEAAVGIGYGAAALPLWEEFVIRFFKYETQLGAVVPKQQIANHLQQLAHLYETSSPVLSNIYALLSCLSPDQLPGGTPRFVAENKQALRSLMQLHPLNVTKADNATMSQPPSPNPLLDTNPFGAVPLSALVQTPTASTKKKQTAETFVDGGHFAAALEEAATHTPQQQGKAEDEDVQSAPPAFVFQSQAAVPAASFQDLVHQQESMDEDIETSRAALRPWARRAEKQAARARSTSPRRSMSRHTPSADMGGQGGLARQVSMSSAGGSGERTIHSYLARSSRDGDVPELISQAQGKLWEMTSAWTEELERIHAAMRELVCRRYRHVDVDKIANGEAGDVEEVHPQEDPTYKQNFSALRGEALKVVMDFTANAGLLQVAQLLYQLEVMVLQSSLPTTKVDKDERDVEVECKCQLLLVLAEVTLDGSTPLICSPLCATLFCQAASGAVPISPHTKVRLCRRILRALASNSQPQQQEREAVTLLKASLDPSTLLTTSSLHDFEACLDTVLFHSHRLLPATVTTLLGCFSLPVYASKLLEGEETRKAPRAGEQSSGWAREESARAPSGLTKVLNLALATLSLKGGAATGGALAQGLLVTGPATYYAAVLQLAITGEEEEGRKAAVAALMQVPAQALPLSVVLDSLMQVAEAMNSNGLAPPHVPQALLHTLLQAPALLAALRSMIAGAGAPKSASKQAAGDSVLWSAKVGSTKAEQEGSGAAGSSSMVALDTSAEPKQAVLLLPVNMTASAGECVQHVVGAWLQSILRKYGSGLEPVPFTEEFTCLLSSLFEPAGSHPWLVDWLWTLYQAVLQPFLCPAGPASDGTAITRFREYWQSLPWHKATFHCISPDALQLVASFLLSPDRATLQLLHVLDWRPVLQQLAPVTANLHSNISDATAQQVSLLDSDMSSSTTDAGVAPSLQSGARSSQGGLDAGAKAWAAQLLLLVMQAYVIMADDDLPDWISRLIRGRSDRDLIAGNDESGALWLTSSLRLPQVFAAAQLETLQQRLSRQGPSETPFLLQAFVMAPNLVEGDPNPRLLTLARLLVQGAKLNGSAKAAAVAAHVIQDVMLVSVCRGFHTEAGAAGPAAEGRLEMLECWHLTADDMAALTKECLLPLAEMHASLGLAQSLQPEGALAVAPKPQQTEAGKQWRAPALSSLVNRLAQPPGKQPVLSPPARSKPEDVEHYLDPSSSDEEEQAAASAEPKEDASSGQAGLSIYSAAAGPFRSLLACIATEPGVLVTLEPLPFANAEGPLKLLASDRSPAPHTDPTSHTGEAQAPSAHTGLHAHSPSKSTAAPGKESSMSNLKSRMAALKKGMGIGSTDVKGTKLPHTAAATDATSIQLRLALIIHESMQQQRPEFALSLLRVIFTTTPMPESTLLCALTEDIVLGLLLRQQGSTKQEPSGSHAGPPREQQGERAASLDTGRNGLDRQSSYTEVALAIPVPTDTQLMTPFESTPAAPDGTSDQSSPPLSTCLEDLPPSVLMGLCRAGAAHRMPLTVALLSERARQQAAALDSLAWRDLVADVVEVTAKAQVHPAAHLHLLAPWLQALRWLADARWRKLGAAAPVDQVQQLLDCLQGHVALLWTAFPPNPTSHESSLFSGAAERLRLARSEVKARLSRGESGSLPGTPTTPSEAAFTPLGRPSGKLGAPKNEADAAGSKSRTGLMGMVTRNKEADVPQAAMPAPHSKPGRFANLRARLGRPSESTEQETHPELEPESRLGSKLAGFKNRLLKPSSIPASRAQSASMDPHMLTQPPAAPPAFSSGPSPSPLDSAYDFGALAEDRQEARQAAAMQHATASEAAGAARRPAGEATYLAAGGVPAPSHPQQGHAGGGVGVKGNLTDRMAGNLRKAMGIGSKEADLSKQTQPESEGPQVAAQAAAAAVLVPVGLAAFAVSAYIRSTLCPSLQSYSPQPLSSISTADLLQLAGSGAEASGSSTAQQQCLLQHMQRSVAALSAMQCATPLIQVQQVQADLDSLEEVCTQSCLLAPSNASWHEYSIQLQDLLAKGSSVEQFQLDLQALLFAGMPFLRQLS